MFCHRLLERLVRSCCVRKPLLPLGSLALSLTGVACAGAELEPPSQDAASTHDDDDDIHADGNGNDIDAADDAAKHALTPPASGGPPAPVNGPPPSALALIGGQTGSDADGDDREAAGPCPVLRRTDYALDTPTPLGFSGEELERVLFQRGATVRWLSGESSEVTLHFEAGSIATLLERVPAAPGSCAPDVLRLPIELTWSSREPDLEGRFRGVVIAESLALAAGIAVAGSEELGSALRERSGGFDALRLVYEIGEGDLSGWLLSPGVEATVRAEIISSRSENQP